MCLGYHSATEPADESRCGTVAAAVTRTRETMPLPGGPADKLGNRYETWWTVWQFVRMLQGACESIRIESPIIDKAEFVLSVGAIHEWHQAKRSHSTGRWTLQALAGLQVLQGIGNLPTGLEVH